MNYLNKNYSFPAMLLADCLEPKQIIEKLGQSAKVRAIRLKFCDYSFSDVAIERKTLSDFFSSIKSGRIFDQVEGMNRHYSESYLIIEGFFDFSYVNDPGYLYKLLLKITLDFDAKILFSCDLDSTSEAILSLYARKSLNYTKEIKKDKHYYASKLFGISTRKLDMLMDRFGSIKNIAAADKKDFKGISSIGSATTKKVKETMELRI